MKTSSKSRMAGRRVAAAASQKSERIRSAPMGAGLFDISKKDASGKVMITSRGGKTKVPANMVNLVIRAATELLGLPYDMPVPAKGQADKAPAGNQAPAAKAPPGKVSTAAPAPQRAVAKKTAAKKAAGKTAERPAAQAAPAPVTKGRRGRRKAEDQIAHPPQLKSKIPESIRDYKTKYESAKGQSPSAGLARRYFEDEKKWGYDATISGKVVGKLLFVHPGPGGWSLVPTDERLAERSIKPTLHASPISALVRVTNGWSRALSGQSESAVSTATAA